MANIKFYLDRLHTNNAFKIGVVIVSLLIFGCSSDDEPVILRDRIGTIIRVLPCGTTTGFSVQIDVEGIEGQISAAIEPELAVSGIKIKFDMEQSNVEFEGHACAFNPYTPYKLTNVTLIE
ncbi:hypothetical protein [Maribacter sp. 2304DJ31-5]|uniref:hypothetical protein n=1 Tax=Maribacter sp. 2304DJ31-5 TaxID=3386273 RepID=UPI0039BCC937